MAQLQTPKFDGRLGQAKTFLTYYNSFLVPHIQAHHPYIVVWELYKPLPRVLGKSAAIPSDIAEFCRPENIASTLRNLSSGPRTTYEGRPDSTPQAGYVAGDSQLLPQSDRTCEMRNGVCGQLGQPTKASP